MSIKPVKINEVETDEMRQTKFAILNHILSHVQKTVNVTAKVSTTNLKKLILTIEQKITEEMMNHQQEVVLKKIIFISVENSNFLSNYLPLKKKENEVINITHPHLLLCTKCFWFYNKKNIKNNNKVIWKKIKVPSFKKTFMIKDKNHLLNQIIPNILSINIE